MITKEKFLNNLKKYDQDLYLKIKESNIDEDILFENIGDINTYIDDLEQKRNIIRKVNFSNNKFSIEMVYLNKDEQIDNLNQIIKNNFKIHLGIEDISKISFAKEYENFIEIYNLVNKELNQNKNDILENYLNFYSFLSSLDKKPFLFVSSKSQQINLINTIIGFLKRLSISNTVSYISTSNLYSDIKLNFDSKQLKIDKLFNTLKNVDYLIFEDFSYKYMKKWFLIDFIFPLLEYRKNNNKITSYLIYLSLDNFKQKLKTNNDLSTEDINELISYFSKLKII